ncbi:MAG: hypothetical protein JNG84_06570 [Archangium sp.]|nr:hypothetical protein [Archangium sp.]
MTEQAPHLLHILRIDSKGLRARVEVNGFEIFSEPNAKERLLETKLNHLVVVGENDLVVKLGPPLDDELKPQTPAGHFRILYMVAEHGKAVPPDALRSSWKWPSTEPEVKLELAPLIPAWATAFDVPAAEGYGRWAWQDAPEVELTTAERSAISDLVTEVRETLANRDVAGLRRLVRLKHQELSRALDVPFANVDSEFGRAYGELFQDPTGVMDPVVPISLLLRPVGRGRALHVTTQSGGPPITGTWNKQPFRFGLTVSKINDQWTIVR